jgi:hypothetical protein
MTRKTWCLVLVTVVCLAAPAAWAAEGKEIGGVSFPAEKQAGGKTLKLNGVALRKALMVVKVFAGGFYLENPTSSAEEAIMSEQVKHFSLHYLTDKATAQKLQEGFLESMAAANPPELVAAHRKEIDLYASWLNQDMAPGATSETTYVPGKGLTLVYKGVEKGTIPGAEFAQMYFRYNLGEKADAGLRSGYLGK